MEPIMIEPAKGRPHRRRWATSGGGAQTDLNIIEPGPHVLLFHGLAIVHQSAVRQAPTQRASAGGWGIGSHGVAEL
jgi:hypothetical protein